MEEEQIDFDYFADVEFDLTMPEIVDVLARIDGRAEEYEASTGVGTRRYSVAVSIPPDDATVEAFAGLTFVPLPEAAPSADAEQLVARVTIEYELPSGSNAYAPSDSFVVRFTNDGYEVFTREHYLRTSPTELFELLKPELEAGP